MESSLSGIASFIHLSNFTWAVPVNEYWGIVGKVNWKLGCHSGLASLGKGCQLLKVQRHITRIRLWNQARIHPVPQALPVLYAPWLWMANLQLYKILRSPSIISLHNTASSARIICHGVSARLVITMANKEEAFMLDARWLLLLRIQNISLPFSLGCVTMPDSRASIL